MTSALIDHILQTTFVFLYGFFTSIGIVELKRYKKNPNADECEKWFAITYISIGAVGFILAILRVVVC